MNTMGRRVIITRDHPPFDEYVGHLLEFVEGQNSSWAIIELNNGKLATVSLDDIRFDPPTKASDDES